MNPIKRSFILVSTIGLLAIGCGNRQSPVSDSSTPAAKASSASETEISTAPENGHDAKPQAGGQVVESGPYHLEFGRCIMEG